MNPTRISSRILRRITNGDAAFTVRADHHGVMLEVSTPNIKSQFTTKSPNNLRTLAAHLLVEADELQRRKGMDG